MTKKNQNFEMHIGDTRILYIPVTDATTGQPLDMTGCAAVWVLCESDESSPLITKTSEIGDGIVINLVDKRLEITIDPTDTEPVEGDPLQSGTYYHEAELTDPSGHVSTVTTGYAKLLPSQA